MRRGRMWRAGAGTGFMVSSTRSPPRKCRPYEPKTDGEESYVLCEINANSTFAFPEHAMPRVAQATLEQIRRAR